MIFRRPRTPLVGAFLIGSSVLALGILLLARLATPHVASCSDYVLEMVHNRSEIFQGVVTGYSPSMVTDCRVVQTRIPLNAVTFGDSNIETVVVFSNSLESNIKPDYLRDCLNGKSAL